MTTTHAVFVTHHIEVSVDETKFTPEFLSEFAGYMYDFQDIPEHIEYLAQLYARGLANDNPDEFIEGYGKVSDFGIKFREISVEAEIEQ